MQVMLGIETSCDETSAAVVRVCRDTERPGGVVLSSVVHSQIALHAEYGGVVPELASRAHIRHIAPVVAGALAQAGIAASGLDGIAVTAGPGLAGALLVGIGMAKGLALAGNLPWVGVHHMEGHMLSPLLAEDAPAFPFIALLVSGGHTLLVRAERFGHYTLLGGTRDDSVGEAFDKGARLLGLGYPGGPAIARMALGGTPDTVTFPHVLLDRDRLEFSFSGLKTALRVLLAQRPEVLTQPELMRDVAAAYQEALLAPLVNKSLLACQQTGTPRLVVAGGVGANQRLRILLQEHADRAGIQLCFPPMALCTDNGAMIAFAGGLRMLQGTRSSMDLNARPRWSVEEIAA